VLFALRNERRQGPSRGKRLPHRNRGARRELVFHNLAFEIEMIRSVVIVALLCAAPMVMEMDFTGARQQVANGSTRLP
jgi:hypothetical protein